MSRPLQPSYNGLSPANPAPDNYPTLKQSLSASLTNGFQQEEFHPESYFGTQKRDEQAPRSNRTSPQTSVSMPKTPSAAETALAALQYLPTPLLVLSNLKTVIIANEAMGRFLGLEGYTQGKEGDGNGNTEGEAATAQDILQGRTLSQIGIDMLQGGQPVWVSWEVRQSELWLRQWLLTLTLWCRNSLMV